MGQALSNLATAFDFELLVQNLDSASNPTFEFFIFEDLVGESSEVNADIEATFSLSLAGKAPSSREEDVALGNKEGPTRG